MSEFGFKQITYENWLRPDEISQHFRGTRSMREYIGMIFAPTLSETVPKDVRALFEVTRGALLYGYLFYPLYSLAVGQLWRVGEAAIIHKCRELGAPTVKNDKNKEKKMTFSDCINWLRENGVLSQDDADHWHVLRSLRNSASHVTRQSILTPGMAMAMFERAAMDINGLFNKGVF